MAGGPIEIEGLTSFRRNLHKVAPEVDRQFGRKIRQIIRPIREEATRRAPVRSGALRGSIKYSVVQKGASLYSKLPYANAQEWGTSGRPDSKVQPRGVPIKIRGRHFVYGAIQDAKPKIEKGVKQVFEDAAHGNGFDT